MKVVFYRIPILKAKFLNLYFKKLLQQQDIQ